MMDASKIIVLTAEQLEVFATDVAKRVVERMGGKGEAEAEQPIRFAYGLRGICGLFNVSVATAQKYKNTFLAPAIMQRGRKITIDVNKALKLYAEAGCNQKG